MRKVPVALAAVFALLSFPALAQTAGVLAPTPPMGWNSWDSYGLSVTESEFKANVDWVASHLKQYGWQYLVVDEGWYLQNPNSQGKPAWKFTMDANGRYLPAPNRFASAAGESGFKPLADYVHAKGLKFGIHIIRGIPREAVDKNLPIAGSHFHAADAADTSDKCRWNPDNYGLKANPAAQAYYDSIAKMYAGWGLDFIKVDCISQPYKADEIRMMSLALQHSGRPIVLSLSPGPTPLSEADDVKKYAQMWRISDDVWDHWGVWKGHEFSQGILGQATTAAAWAPHIQVGHWPDADMLPIGHLGPRPGADTDRQSHLTPEEQRSMLTLWSMFRSPLMMGGDLPSTDARTISLLTNTEVLRVDQHSSHNQPVITRAGDRAVWTAQAEHGSTHESDHYLSITNLSDSSQTIAYSWKELGWNGDTYRVRDLWEHKDLGPMPSVKVTLPAHASVLYAVRGAPKGQD